MNWLNWERPKKSRTTALSDLGLISFCGVIWSTPASKRVMRSRTSRSVRARPTRHWLASKLSDRPNAPAAEVINIVGHPLPFAQLHQILHGRNEVVLDEDSLLLPDLKSKFLIDLVPSDPSEIITLRIKEEPLEHAASILHGGRIAGAQLAIDILEGLLLIVGGILFQRLDDRVVLLGIDHVHALVTQRDQLPDCCRVQRLKGTCHRDFAVADILEENLGADLLLVQILAQIERR